ncbi:DAL82 (YNL314W) [Zygosaccharomyces parabailii]|nr:DAL82 (YNL314W) [Zygosaccharomyces parabailii]CDH12980.1 uncharacterized protein ZBAI_04766 [Zygosaccharomyces bailii ISA1307]
MPDGLPFEDDDLLLELMDRYKPHLKPYAYRLQTWSQVLEQYNTLTDNHYRQIRTLKKKFERLKEVYEYDATKIQTTDIKRLERLIKESEHVTKKTHSTSLERGQVRHITGEPKMPKTDTGSSSEMHTEVNADNGEGSSDSSQPPPLDSITVGFPHSASLREPRNSVASSSSHRSTAPGTGLFEESTHEPQLQSQVTPDDPNKTELLTNVLSILVDSASSAGIPQHNATTLEKLYLEFKQYKSSQEEFQRQLLQRLDVLTAAITHKEPFHR